MKYFFGVVGNHHYWIAVLEFRQLSALKARHKHSELLSRLKPLIDLDMLEKVVSNVDIPTMSHASERGGRTIASCVAFRVCNTQVIICWVALGNREDGDLV